MALIVQCPRCGGTEHRPALDFRRPSIIAFLFGGLILMALNSLRRKEKFRCTNCQHVFYSHTQSSVAFLIILIAFILLSILGVLAMIYGIG